MRERSAYREGNVFRPCARRDRGRNERVKNLLPSNEVRFDARRPSFEAVRSDARFRLWLYRVRTRVPARGRTTAPRNRAIAIENEGGSVFFIVTLHPRSHLRIFFITCTRWRTIRNGGITVSPFVELSVFRRESRLTCPFFREPTLRSDSEIEMGHVIATKASRIDDEKNVTKERFFE